MFSWWTDGWIQTRRRRREGRRPKKIMSRSAWTEAKWSRGRRESGKREWRLERKRGKPWRSKSCSIKSVLKPFVVVTEKRIYPHIPTQPLYSALQTLFISNRTLKMKRNVTKRKMTYQDVGGPGSPYLHYNQRPRWWRIRTWEDQALLIYITNNIHYYTLQVH